MSIAGSFCRLCWHLLVHMDASCSAATQGFQALQPRVGWSWPGLVAETLAVRRCMDFRRHVETVREPSPSPDMAGAR
jgi:hypothetical protein